MGQLSRFAIPLSMGAFLLFFVQPLAARLLLPQVGGSPVVWSTCLVFFQTALLAGYGLAHGLGGMGSRRRQGLIHLGLGACGAALLLTAGDLAVDTHRHPALAVLMALTAGVGLPYVLLAATAPLIQSWYARVRPGASPYFLYAISNAASLVALVAYPLIIEPNLSLGAQRSLWGGAYVLFVVACAVGLLPLPEGSAPVASKEGGGPRPAPWMWLALSALPSLLLMAITQQLTQEIAPIPLLWLAPLALYLVSFILCFEAQEPPRTTPWAIAAALSTVAFAVALALGPGVSLGWHLVTGLGALFFVCMALHGELSRRRPAPAHLTAFYLWMATGGALGGGAGALLSPLLFDSYAELPLGLAAAMLLIGHSVYTNDGSPLARGKHPLVWGALAGLFWLLAFTLAVPTLARQGETLAQARNFYGVLRVYEEADRLTMKHGSIQHGFQFKDESLRRLPTSYYAPQSGAALALEAHPRRTQGDGHLNAAIIGLGVGTLAALGRPSDTLRFYEINPVVIDGAQRRFTYLSDSPAQIEVIEGDGRLALKRDLEEGRIPPLDVLAVDAFSSDAIPVHLLTLECIQLYWQALEPDGILAIHVSNNHLDLTGVVGRLAAETGAQVMRVDRLPELSIGAYASTWMLLSRDPTVLKQWVFQEYQSEVPIPPAAPLWTDDYSALVDVMVW